MAKRGPKGPSRFTENFINALALKLTDWIKVPSNWYLTDFAIENDIWEQRFVEFAQSNDKFSEALKKAKQIQTSRLVKLGLARKVDTGMAIFTLKNISGWRDRQENEGVIIKNYVQIYRPEPYSREEVVSAAKETHRSL
jgi:hypothetical protein